MFEIEEIAAIFKMTPHTITRWIVRDKLVQGRVIFKQGKTRVVITPEEFAKLLDIKAPLFDDVSKYAARSFQRRQAIGMKAARASALSRGAKWSKPEPK